MPTAVHPLVDERVSLTFASAAPHTTCWLEMTHPADAVPQALLDDLAAIGFAVNTRFAAMPAYTATEDVADPSTPLGQRLVFLDYKVMDVILAAPHGSELFGGWSTAEKRTHMAAARRVLRRYGFLNVPVWKKTLQDML